MNQASEYLLKTKKQVLSTIGLDGKPKVRPFQFMFEENGKMYFCTSNQKDVYGEMCKNENVELCASGDDNSWLRLCGKAVFVNDITLKEKVLETSPLVKSIYGTPDNPVFELFYLSEAGAVFADFSGNPPKRMNL